MKTNTGKDIIKIYSNSGLDIKKLYNNAGGTIETLQPIVAGDDLSGKTLYCDFPANFHEEGMIEFGNVIVGAGTNRIVEDRMFWSRGYYTTCYFIPGGNYIFNYNYEWESDPEGVTIYENHSTVVCPADFGVVASVNTSAASYQHIKIYK